MAKSTPVLAPEYKKLSDESLAHELDTLRLKVLQLRFEQANRSLKDTTLLLKTRRAVSKILTQIGIRARSKANNR